MFNLAWYFQHLDIPAHMTHLHFVDNMMCHDVPSCPGFFRCYNEPFTKRNGWLFIPLPLKPLDSTRINEGSRTRIKQESNTVQKLRGVVTKILLFFWMGVLWKSKSQYCESLQELKLRYATFCADKRSC